ncbi:hypothetical protein E4T80_11610 [Muribacter muris]|uniref:Uncharacterized protein n=1 Tax=Muribacter muris TaxID=67855 RepID=A0A4Y9JU00_9PAST|nr:hypothetical protein [Muribacter muris]MBF0786108.1 hypothetical protein [Muribacter muris]MBF0826471.1 hypothetical protein [Muribacter muris]TFV07946.1 hypothetical protein E4T80_11610 [Muribacter muris]
MATRLMTICHALISNAHLGISEKESYFEVHFLNARNEISEIERALGIELKRVREESPAGRLYTRYLVADSEQVHKIANFYNGKLKANRYRKGYTELTLISESQIQRANGLLGHQ